MCGRANRDVKDLFEGGEEFAYQGLEYATTLTREVLISTL